MTPRQDMTLSFAEICARNKVKIWQDVLFLRASDKNVRISILDRDACLLENSARVRMISAIALKDVLAVQHNSALNWSWTRLMDSETIEDWIARGFIEEDIEFSAQQALGFMPRGTTMYIPTAKGIELAKSLEGIK